MGGICTTASSTKVDDSQSVMTFRFIEAAATGKLEEVEKCLDAGFDVNAKDWSGRSALHLASAEGHVDVVRLLLKKGANVQSKDKRGNVPLLEASLSDCPEIIKLLCDAGGSLSNESFDEMKIRISKKISNCRLSFESSSDDVIEGELVDNEWHNKICNLNAFSIMEAFPKSIAVAMIQGQEFAPIQRESASLFYSDIVGFTTLSSNISPEKVSNMLVRLFSCFDQIAHIHGVQKVDMIGDAYIAATNLLEDQLDDHAARLAHFASDITTAASEMPVDEDDPEGPLGHVELRIGLHCGPVSARVVSAGALRYTLFGDTVHVASAMESSGSPGRIQCSDAFARLVSDQADDFLLVPRRDKVAVKAGRVRSVQGFWLSSLRRRKIRQGSMTVKGAGDLHVGKGMPRSNSSDAMHRLNSPAWQSSWQKF